MLDDIPISEQEKIGNLIIEARKQNPSIPAHQIHDLILANKYRMQSDGLILFTMPTTVSNGNGSGH